MRVCVCVCVRVCACVCVDYVYVCVYIYAGSEKNIYVIIFLMIGGCVKSDMCREKLKGKREVYRRSDGRQELRSCIRSGISRVATGVH